MKKKILVLGIVLAMVLAVAVPMAVLAQSDTGTTDVEGDVGNTYTLTPPIAQDFLTFSQGDNSITTLTITASTNDIGISTVDIEVRDNNQSSNIGYMLTGGTDPLAAPFQVQGGDLGTGGWTNLPTVITTMLTLASGDDISGGTFSITDFGINQPIANLTAETVGTYTITLYFEATFNTP